MNGFSFDVVRRDKKTSARIGVIHTPHGDITTPAFVPVGTQATVKSLTPEELTDLHTQLFFVNTYHMYLRPGIDVIKKFGGLHTFMNWNKPLITDSGGFQVFSLGRGVSFKGGTLQGGIKPYQADKEEEVRRLVKITDDGVEFQSHWDGSRHMFTPESSMKWQWELGSDIHIAFDDCTPYPVTEKKARESMERTHRWAVRSLDAHKALRSQFLVSGKTNNQQQTTKNKYQALYGSVQGSVFKNLREESARFISSMDFDGIAIGGVSVGESKKEMVNVLDWVTPLLPASKPRHLLGVGEIDDIFALVAHGVDTFDCVQPTRLARVGILFVTDNPLNGDKSDPMKRHELDINKALYEKDTHPIEKDCSCYTCAHFSRAYIHHLFHVRELLAYRLATIHNIHFVQSLVADIRLSIEDGSFLDLSTQWLYNKRGGEGSNG